MNLLPTPEQDQLVSAARRFLASELPVVADAAGASVLGARRRAWPKIAGLGWLSLAVPAEHGGSGASTCDQVLLCRELGRGLAPGPFVGTMLGAEAAARAGRSDLADRLGSGSATAGLGEAWQDRAARIEATVTGRFRVVDADESEFALLVADDGVALVDLSVGRADLTVTPLEPTDPSAPVSIVVCRSVPAEAFVPADMAPLPLSTRLLAAALLVGMIEACRDQSAAYAAVREQFGRPIGSFQAVKHRCADMAVRAEASSCLTFLAAAALDCADSEGRFLVASAKSLASEWAVTSAADNVQNHGGTGFTAACSAHRYVRRALVWSATLGSTSSLLLEVVR